MSEFDFLNKDSIYFQYFRNGDNSFMHKVKFFEDHKADIEYLDIDLKQEILIDYILCLFEVGRYEKFLNDVDYVVEMVIAENIFEYNGENIYNLLLRKKAACYINLQRPSEALKLIRQLLRVEPDNINLPYFYYICNRKISQGSEDIIKGIAIISLMCGLSLKFAETFVVDPFFSDYLKAFSTITTSFFIIGSALLVSNEVYRRWYINREIKKIQRK